MTVCVFLLTINTKIVAIQKILRGINFVKFTKIFSSVDPVSGYSCLVSPRSAWELQQKKSVPQRIPVKITTKNTTKKKLEGN